MLRQTPKGQGYEKLSANMFGVATQGIYVVTPILKHISFKPFQICGSIFVHYSRPINI